MKKVSVKTGLKMKKKVSVKTGLKGGIIIRSGNSYQDYM